MLTLIQDKERSLLVVSRDGPLCTTGSSLKRSILYENPFVSTQGEGKRAPPSSKWEYIFLFTIQTVGLLKSF